jgi:hypothetical protein
MAALPVTVALEAAVMLTAATVKQTKVAAAVGNLLELLEQVDRA